MNFSRPVAKFALFSVMILSSVPGFASPPSESTIAGEDQILEALNLSADTSGQLAIEALGHLSGPERADVLHDAESNAQSIALALQLEESKLHKALAEMDNNKAEQTAYDVTGLSLWLSMAPAGVMGMKLILPKPDSPDVRGLGYTPQQRLDLIAQLDAKRIVSIRRARFGFWTSAAVMSISYFSHDLLSVKVQLQRDQAESLSQSVKNLKDAAVREQAVIQTLKQFYKIDVTVNVAK